MRTDARVLRHLLDAVPDDRLRPLVLGLLLDGVPLGVSSAVTVAAAASSPSPKSARARLNFKRRAAECGRRSRGSNVSERTRSARG